MDEASRRFLTLSEVDRRYYTREQKGLKSQRLPGCDYDWHDFPGRQIAQVSYAKLWRDYPKWAPQMTGKTRNYGRHLYRQAVILYTDPAQQKADFNRLWRSPCEGARHVYEESTGSVNGWHFSRRIQPGYCTHGGMCVLVADYLTKGTVTLVTALQEAGTRGNNPDRKTAIKRATDYRSKLTAKMHP